MGASERRRVEQAPPVLLMLGLAGAGKSLLGRQLRNRCRVDGEDTKEILDTIPTVSKRDLVWETARATALAHPCLVQAIP